MTKEIFKPIPNYEGLYEVSNMGNVKSLKYGRERFLKPSKHRYGYSLVSLSKNNVAKTWLLHQIIAMSFMGHKPCGYDLVIDHINNNPADNRLCNLQIISHRENIFKTQGQYSSQYKGVHWHKVKNKWQSIFGINKKKHHLGYFDNEYDAHLAYQKCLNNLTKKLE